MASMTEFGSRVDRVLKEKGLRDSDLAKKMDVKPPQIFALKHKTKNPRPETVRAIAKALGKPMDYFIEKPKVDTQGKKNPPPGGWAPIRKGEPKSQRRPEKESLMTSLNSLKKEDVVEEQLHLLADETPVSLVELGLEPQHLVGEEVPLRMPEDKSEKQPAADTMELKVYVSFELNGQVISRKQIKRLPADFEF